MLDSLREGLQSAVKRLVGSNVVDEKSVKEFVRDLQRALIQSDVNVRIALEVTDRVQKRALEEKPAAGVTKKDQIVSILYEELARLLGGEGGLQLSKDKTNVVVMLGVQGSGKTTTTGKLARLYSKRGFRVGVVAADTFRPGAVTQLKTLAAS
ncbi:MAG TPA: signal recognition particle receptor subunit alpha, partial [Nitrososphaerales archaeon]|nr:signal recognition particle receptor subunit alpha [Nitrososphaerales archaeon]